MNLRLIAAGGGALLLVGGAAARTALTRRPAPAPAPDPPAEAEAEPAAAAPPEAHEAYRLARRAFNQGDRDALHAAAHELWVRATLAEKPARWLARDTRALLALLEERRDLEAIPGAYAQRRAAKVDKRIGAAGTQLFAAKPAKVQARIAGA